MEWLNFLKEMLSYYDPATDKIHNTKEGSWVYVHEEGHRKQRKLIQATRVIPEFSMFLTILFLVVQENIMARFFFIIYLSYLMFLEIDAVGYMYWIWRNKKKVIQNECDRKRRNRKKKKAKKT